MNGFLWFLFGVWGVGTLWAWLQGIACWNRLMTVQTAFVESLQVFKDHIGTTKRAYSATVDTLKEHQERLEILEKRTERFVTKEELFRNAN